MNQPASSTSTAPLPKSPRKSQPGPLLRPLPAATLQRLFRDRAEDQLPLRIAHRRIYILPTRRGWAFLLVLLIMLVASINYSLSLGYALSFLFTGLFSATLLHTYRNLAGLSVQRLEAGKAFAGEPVEFVVELYNDSALDRYGLRVTPRLHTPPACIVDVPATTSTPVKVRVPTAERGTQSLGRLTLQSDYPLGLWTTWSYVHTQSQALVFPTPEHAPPPLPGAPVCAGDHSTAQGTAGDVAGLRGYQLGDSLSSIAWKTAARGQGLHVRLFDTERAGDQLQLSLSACATGTEEQRLSRLCAWVLDAERLGLDYALELPGASLPSGRGASARLAALSALARHGKPVE